MPVSNASNTNDNSTEETMIEQQEEFGVGEFIDSAKEYTNDFFNEDELNNFFNSAIKGEVDNSSILKKILSLLGQEFVDSIKACLLYTSRCV